MTEERYAFESAVEYALCQLCGPAGGNHSVEPTDDDYADAGAFGDIIVALYLDEGRLCDNLGAQWREFRAARIAETWRQPIAR